MITTRSALSLLLVLSLQLDSRAQENVRTQQPQVEKAIVAGQSAAPEPSKTVKQRFLSGGPQAKWIWGPSIDTNYVFHKTVKVESVRAAAIIATCDNAMQIALNGQPVMSSEDWQSPKTAYITKVFKPGLNTITIAGQNQGSAAGLAFKLAWVDQATKRHFVVSDASWKVSKDKSSSADTAAKVIAPMGAGPWGNVFASQGGKSNLINIPRNVFQVLPGYQVELLYTVPKNEQGSWVSMGFDHRGRIIASDQGGKGLYRITPPKLGSKETTRVEKLNVKMTGVQGMVYAFDSLYVSVNGGPGSGFYRLRDTNNDDQYDEVKKLKSFQGGGEHGPHAVRLSPDGKSLYVIAGNHTNPPAGITHSRVPQNWSEDHLLPRRWDARGHAKGRLAPGGWICKTDPEGKTWEVVSIGYRNPYDMDFSPEGELFAYDADMEWDMGSPWYRPTRVVHATSGSEFGWRSGTGKWPTYYVDSLPPAVDIGPGSPTGVAFGTGAKFPAKYQRALFVVDWTFGTMYAVHLTPRGSSYTAVREEFISRKPLPLTDLAIGPDGALYFTVGGRGTQSALYRVTYKGDESTAPVGKNAKFAEQRNLRQKLEALHTKAANGAEAIDTLWPYLAHSDRHIRYAARVGVEHQDPKYWESRAMSEDNAQAFITATVALARQGDKALRHEIIAKLNRLDFNKLNQTQQLEALRAYALVFIRMGRPSATGSEQVVTKLNKLYPAKADALNAELSRVLVYLNSPQVVSKTMALIRKKSPPAKSKITELLSRNEGYGRTIAAVLANQVDQEKMNLAFILRNVRFGWTTEERREFHQWLNEAQKRSGGASFQGFLKNIRDDALANTSDAERKALTATTIKPPPKPSELPKPEGPGQKWSISDLTGLAAKGLQGRDFARGQRAFAAAKCSSCHRYAGEGGSTGPDLTNVAGRFSLRDLSEALIQPSKVISDQYQAHKIRTDTGKIYTGRIVSKTKKSLTVVTDPFDGTKLVEIPLDNVDRMSPSRVSLMPADLLNPLNKTEVLDMLAYLMSRGNPNDPMFKK